MQDVSVRHLKHSPIPGRMPHLFSASTNRGERCLHQMQRSPRSSSVPNVRRVAPHPALVLLRASHLQGVRPGKVAFLQRPCYSS